MINKRLVLAGVAKQTAKGSAAANPTYDFGVLSGAQLPDFLTDQGTEEITLDKLTAPGVNRDGFHPSLDFACRGYPALLGALLLAALGADAVTGAGDPYSHTITDATDVNYWTVFGSLGTDYFKMPDSKLDKLTIKWDGPGPIELDTSWLGCDWSWLAAPWTPTTTQRDSNGKYRGGANINTLSSHFYIDVDATPAVTAQPVVKGQIDIANNIDQVILAQSIKPSDVPIGERKITAQITLAPSDLLALRRLLTGTAAGTGVTEAEVYGALELYFVGDTNQHDLKISALKSAFHGQFPAPDPKGGHAEYDLMGDVLLPASGAAMTALLRNAVATY
jgi:hypothetical protein